MPDTASARVLLVDDEELICRTLQRLLKNQTRFELHTATNYMQATRVFEAAGPFDILLTDLRLHDITGVELAQRLLRRKPDLRVVFMSGSVPKAFAAAYFTIEKPFGRDELLQALEAALAAPQGKVE